MLSHWLSSGSLIGNIFTFFAASFSPAVVVEGLRTDATCHVSSGTQSVRINWKRNGKLTRRKSFTSVSQKDGGDWTCQAAYNGGVVEATTSLQVKGKCLFKKQTNCFFFQITSARVAHPPYPLVFQESSPLRMTLQWCTLLSVPPSPYPASLLMV